ncbi:MAG: nucleoside hydrolase [Oceanicaulis sp.]
MNRKVILDCDPGVDDCIALMAALGAPDAIDLLGVSVVAGNVPVEICARNAASVLTLAGRCDVKVHAGCARPMVFEPVFADHIHGETGLGAARLPEPEAPVQARHAVDFLCDMLERAEPGSITLVLTGPMTNAALALVKAPGIAEAIAEIVVMGGAREAGGNITASAEFNIFADPHAAHVVLNAGLKTTLIGLDATLQLRCTPQRLARLKASSHRAPQAAAAMVEHVNGVYGEIYGDEGAALHDPCTIGYLLAPHLFAARPAAVHVDTRDGLTRGHTAVDIHLLSGAPANVSWVTGLDAPALFDLLLEHMERV